jgi:hypothetical protein
MFLRFDGLFPDPARNVPMFRINKFSEQLARMKACCP